MKGVHFLTLRAMFGSKCLFTDFIRNGGPLPRYMDCSTSGGCMGGPWSWSIGQIYICSLPWVCCRFMVHNDPCFVHYLHFICFAF